MKKRIQKLSLNRETLRHLEGGRLAVVAGAPDQEGPPDDTTGSGGPIYTGPFYGGCPSYGPHCTFGC